MLEKEVDIDNTIEKVKSFAEVLAGWDTRIVRIVAISDLVSQDFNHGSKIDLVCTFDPEPIGDKQGYVSVINLLLRDDHEKITQQLGINHPIDLGFTMGEKILLPSGEILNEMGEHIVLWPDRE